MPCWTAPTGKSWSGGGSTSFGGLTPRPSGARSGTASGTGRTRYTEIAQIIAVADTFDAMYSTRPYRKKLPLATVAAEIQRASGTQLSPKVVDAFMELVNEGAFDDE